MSTLVMCHVLRNGNGNSLRLLACKYLSATKVKFWNPESDKETLLSIIL